MFDDSTFPFYADKIEYVQVPKLYERGTFDPVIVENRDYPSGFLSFIGDPFLDEHPVIRTPPLPFLNYFYPVLCLTVDYRLVLVVKEAEYELVINVTTYGCCVS